MELLLALIISLIAVLIIYFMGSLLAPKPRKSEGKLATYACGESIMPARGPIRTSLFNFATLFMILDVVALLFAFTVNIPPEHRALVIPLASLYAVILLISVYLLARR